MYIDKFYFQYIDIPFIESDIKQLLNHFPLQSSKFDKMDIEVLKELMPNIFLWFKEQNLQPSHSFLINHAPDFKQDIHIDYTTELDAPSIALNLPLNPLAAETVTRMYDLKENAHGYKTAREQNNVAFTKVDPEDVIKITEYYSTSPALINIKKPHSAWNNSNVIRGVLTFRFKQDPTHLIKETT